MKLDKEEFNKFVEEVKAGMGPDFVDTIDAIDSGKQFAFATNEPDQGENVRGKWLDLIEAKLKEHGWYPGIPVMPFPVKGRLVYVLGMRRFA